MEKIMKMQDEHGQILVSRALDPRKMISPKVPETSGIFPSKKPKPGGNMGPSLLFRSTWKMLLNFRNGLDIFSICSSIFKLFDMTSMQNIEKKIREVFQVFVRGLLAPLRIMQKSATVPLAHVECS